MRVTSFGKGFFFAFSAFFIWGMLPLYWKLLAEIDSLHILAFRILFSLVFTGIVLLANKNFAWLTIFKDRKKAGFMILAGIILSVNWGLYIWAVNQGRTLEASLGYYINPLITIVLGLIFFRERLKPLQWAAVFIALAGVTILTVLSGVVPLIPLGLALAFGFYGLIKKKLMLPAMEALGAEMVPNLPIGLLLFCFTFGSTGLSFSGLSGLAYLSAIPIHTWLLLFLCGFVTIVPLYCFAHGAKLLPLSTLGFVQFLAPTLNVIVSVFFLGEIFTSHHLIAFIFIWTAVILYLISLRQGNTKTA